MDRCRRAASALQRIDEVFGPKTVDVSVNTGGAKVHRSVNLPKGPLVDDPLNIIKGKLPSKGQKLVYWSFDDSSLSFKQVKVSFLGPATTVIRGAKISANQFDVETDEMTLHVYSTSDGHLVHVEGPIGLEVRPETKATALAKPAKGSPSGDLAQLTSIKTDKPIDDSDHCTDLKLRLIGADLSRLPSDTGQTVAKEGDAWTLDIHPTSFDASKPQTIVASEVGYEKWTQPSIYVPSSLPAMQQLAAKIVGDKKDVLGASTAIMHYISHRMKYVDGIDLPRDATEILKSGEGVCRDYAVLTVTLLRAAGIPTRVVAGLVYDDGAFYGHAWNEAWDGHQWVGIDSTNDVLNLPADYIKLGQGNVEEAFAVLPPVQAKLTVVEVRH